MTAERKPGSNLGHAATDWNAAFLTYAALSPDKRSYRAVADQLGSGDEPGPSDRTVERHGRERNWKARAAAIDREAQQIAAARLANERAGKLGDVEKLVDATFVYFAGQIRDSKIKMNAGDLRRLHDLRSELWAEQPDPTDTTEPATQATPVDPTERKLEVLRALRDAGVLTAADQDSDRDDKHEQDEQDEQEEVA
jgi:hypothetical protein